MVDEFSSVRSNPFEQQVKKFEERALECPFFKFFYVAHSVSSIVIGSVFYNGLGHFMRIDSRNSGFGGRNDEKILNWHPFTTMDIRVGQKFADTDDTLCTINVGEFLSNSDVRIYSLLDVPSRTSQIKENYFA